MLRRKSRSAFSISSGVANRHRPGCPHFFDKHVSGKSPAATQNARLHHPQIRQWVLVTDHACSTAAKENPHTKHSASPFSLNFT